MREARITAEIECEELAGLIATTARVDRITAQMPIVTLERLREITMTFPSLGPSFIPEGGGTTLPAPPRHRLVVIATSALVTMAMALGLAAMI